MCFGYNVAICNYKMCRWTVAIGRLNGCSVNVWKITVKISNWKSSGIMIELWWPGRCWKSTMTKASQLLSLTPTHTLTYTRAQGTLHRCHSQLNTFSLNWMLTLESCFNVIFWQNEGAGIVHQIWHETHIHTNLSKASADDFSSQRCYKTAYRFVTSMKWLVCETCKWIHAFRS